jgi:ABC-type multidrug transport system ATPase subunit
VIVLTTHSMEEADILGDQIAIMALGKLRYALGAGSCVRMYVCKCVCLCVSVSVYVEVRLCVSVSVYFRLPLSLSVL